MRNNDELTCYLPDQHTVLVEPRQVRGPFLGSLPRFGADVDQFYLIESLPDSHVLGRAARVIAVNPKDQYRFGYRLWLDQKTAMPLKTQLCDAHGQVIEQILFARLEMPRDHSGRGSDSGGAHRGHALGAPGRFRRQRRAGAVGLSRQRAAAGISFDGLRSADARRRDGTRAHLVYSDGLATVSVFVEAPPAQSSGTDDSAERAPRAAHAGPGPGRLGIRILHGGAGPSGDGGGRGSGSDRRVHRPLGQVPGAAPRP